MGFITQADVQKLAQDQGLMADVVKAIVEDPQTMDDLVDDIADKLDDELESNAERGYVNRCVNDIRRRPSQPLIQWRFHPHTVHRGRRLRSTQGPSDA